MARRTALARDFPPNVDAFLVTKLVNVRYLSGFTGSNGALLVRRDGSAVLATDGRYETQAGMECPDVELAVTRSLAVDLAKRAKREGVRLLGFEPASVSVSLHAELCEALGGSATLVDADRPIEALRLVKDDAELELIRRACDATDAAFKEILTTLRAGVTERQAEWLLLAAMREHGADGAAFEPIVAFGTNSAIPHHRPTDRALETGDLVKLDFGAKVSGYHCDMTRTVVLGRAEPWQRELHELVAEVQATGRKAAVPGMSAAELDRLVRDGLADAGHQLPHGLGHGVGLEIHELPFLGPDAATTTLVERMPVTVEPGVYLPGRGGVRIEDTVVVGADGAESLTRSPRELIEL